LKRAETTALETNNFSEAWYRAAARAKCEEILASASDVRQRAADRRVRVKDKAAEYEEIAAYAVWRHQLDRVAVIDLLRKGDEHEFQLLQFAIKTREEEG
jgi:hypothetical protein